MLTHVGTQTIETKRLILRQFQYSDSDSMLKNWIADENIQSWYAEPTYTTQEAVRGLLDQYITSYYHDDYYRWAIIDKKQMNVLDRLLISLLIVIISLQKLNIVLVLSFNILD